MRRRSDRRHLKYIYMLICLRKFADEVEPRLRSVWLLSRLLMAALLTHACLLIAALFTRAGCCKGETGRGWLFRVSLNKELPAKTKKDKSDKIVQTTEKASYKFRNI